MKTLLNIMKTKMLLLAALVGAAAMSANAGVRFGISVALPLPVVVTAPVAVATVGQPTLAVAVVETIPACPSVDYVGAPGYWSYRPTGCAWVPGAWCNRPAHVAYGRFYGGHRW